MCPVAGKFRNKKLHDSIVPSLESALDSCATVLLKFGSDRESNRNMGEGEELGVISDMLCRGF